MEKIIACRVCQQGRPEKFFDLGKQPLANSLLSSPDEPENFYSLSLSRCPRCSLVQLNETVDPKILFSEYVWVTGTSKTANEFAVKFSEELLKRGGGAHGYVLELASNDGTFLKPFVSRGMEVLGIDPAENIARIAEASGIPTRAVFWGKEEAERLLKERGPAQIVFARNVLPHVANTRDFVEGIALSLAEDGLAAIEAHYAKIILEELHYDSIYHEHLCYFTLKSLERLLNDFGLYVFDMIRSPISGGSIVLYIRKKRQKESTELQTHRNGEFVGKTNELGSWQDFAKKSFEHKKALVGILKESKKRGKIIGWGASARSSTLLNFCGIGTDLVEAVVDLNPLKQGKFAAGTHIPIVTPEKALSLNPEAVFIMAWNFKDEIMDALRQKYNYKGRCVVPLPKEPQILTI